MSLMKTKFNEKLFFIKTRCRQKFATLKVGSKKWKKFYYGKIVCETIKFAMKRDSFESQMIPNIIDSVLSVARRENMLIRHRVV